MLTHQDADVDFIDMYRNPINANSPSLCCRVYCYVEESEFHANSPRCCCRVDCFVEESEFHANSPRCC